MINISTAPASLSFPTLSLETLTKLKALTISKSSNLSEVLYFNEDLEIIDEFSSISSLPGEKKYKFAIKNYILRK